MASRGEVWYVDLNPTRGHEQRGVRPALVVSDDRLNNGRAGLVVVVPITTTRRAVPFHVQVDPPEGGLRETSFAMCEAVRSISVERLDRRLGAVDQGTMTHVEDRLTILLDL